MALIYCSECGQQVSDKASTCPKCGTPIAVSNTIKTTGILKVYWKGKHTFNNQKAEIFVNGKSIGDSFSYKSGFEVEIPIESYEMQIYMKMNGIKRFKANMRLNPQQNYVCELRESSGVMGYKLCDENGNVIQSDLYSFGLWIISFLVPLVGIIYYATTSDSHPAKAKSALYASLASIAAGLAMLFMHQI